MMQRLAAEADAILEARESGDVSPLLDPRSDAAGVQYDEELQALLVKHSPGMLAAGETLVIPVYAEGLEPAQGLLRYNTAIWYAMTTGLRYDWDGATFSIYPPSA
jgi:hypothetical protein